jgi:hypothetical protein
VRRTLVAAISVLTIALTCGATPLAASAAPARTITYVTERVGAPQGDYAGFRRIVEATLSDPRGWSLKGRVRFREVPSGAELTVALASAAAITGFGACSAYYSCRVGGLVLINADRWRGATDSYPGRELLHSYRQMVINHEVGHALGFGHVECAGPGAPAAVMQQQSKGLNGCRRNAWPLEGERRRYAALVGVRATAVPAPLVLGRRASHVELGARRSQTLATLGRPQRRAVKGRSERIDFYARPRIAVAYARGRVTAITTRSRADVAAGGVGPGRRVPARLRRRCAGPVGSSRCVTARRGDGRRTTLLLRDGRIAAIRLEQAWSPRASGPFSSRRARPAMRRRPEARGGASASPLSAANGPLAGLPCPGWPWGGAGLCVHGG